MNCCLCLVVCTFTLLQMMVCAGSADARAAENFKLKHQGVERSYLLLKPSRPSEPPALVIALQGLGQTVEELRRSWTLDQVAEREGFAVLYPMALNEKWAYVDSRPVKLPGTDVRVDDPGFIIAVLDRLISKGDVDPTRVYATGVSRGGLMAWTLACRRAERFAAVAPLIAPMLARQVELCRPSRLVPLLILAGTDDWSNNYDGLIREDFRLLSIPETIDFWRQKRGCLAQQAKIVPHVSQPDPTRIVRVTWSNCRDVSPLVFYRVEGGGHHLPTLSIGPDHKKRQHGIRSRALETAEVLWAFFKSVAPGR